MKRDLIHLLAALLTITGLFSCASGPSAPESSDYAKGLRSGDQAVNRNNIDALLNNPASHKEAERPGLATGWGDQKNAAISNQSFVRASSKPAGTDVIYYNNMQGIDAMARHAGRVPGLQTAAGELVEWGVKGISGFLPTYKDDFRYGRLVAGASSSTYTIAVRNRSKSALEIVASVDGLDVMDGKPASFSKRGYIVNPGTTLSIDGFRTSETSVAAFKFSSVANSYANLRSGDTRNVGVIGIAVFTQKGVNPWTWMPEEINRRDKARAFAEAPGR